MAALNPGAADFVPGGGAPAAGAAPPPPLPWLARAASGAVEVPSLRLPVRAGAPPARAPAPAPVRDAPSGDDLDFDELFPRLSLGGGDSPRSSVGRERGWGRRGGALAVPRGRPPTPPALPQASSQHPAGPLGSPAHPPGGGTPTPTPATPPPPVVVGSALVASPPAGAALVMSPRVDAVDEGDEDVLPQSRPGSAAAPGAAAPGLAAALAAAPVPGLPAPDAGTPDARVGPEDFTLLSVVGRGAFGKVFQVGDEKRRQEGVEGAGFLRGCDGQSPTPAPPPRRCASETQARCTR